MIDIKVCTDENTATPSDIIICDENQTPEPSDIKVCVDDDRFPEPPDPCIDASELTLAGPEFAPVGAEYVASGGIGPYGFEFSGGTVTEDGDTATIATVDTCNSGTWSNASGTLATASDSYGKVTHESPTLPYSSSPPVHSGTWEASATQQREMQRRLISTDQFLSNEFYSETAGRFYRISQSGVQPNANLRMQQSTDYTCGATVTVEDACGTIVTLDVSAVP